MRKFIFIVFANFLALYMASLLFPSIQWESLWVMGEAALLLTLLNWFLRPLLMLIALPLNIISLGLFVPVINAWMIMLTSSLLQGAQGMGFWIALATAVLVIVLNAAAKKLDRNIV